MAKKAPKKSASKKATAKAPPKKTTPVKASKPRGARSQALPGMEQIRNVRLDNLCEGIAEERSAKNRAIVEETSMVQEAMTEMATKKINVYKHGGIELVLVPGSARLRVRLVKDQGDADVSDGTVTTDNGDDEDDLGS